MTRNTTFFNYCVRETKKTVLNKGGYVCVLFMDVSKDFDTIIHDFLLAKLRAYSFSNALNLMEKNWKQKTQIDNNFGLEKKVTLNSIIKGLILSIVIIAFIIM